MTFEELLESVKAVGRPFHKDIEGRIVCEDGRCPLGLLVVEKHKLGGDGFSEEKSHFDDTSVLVSGTLKVETTMPLASSAATYLGLSPEVAARVARAADNMLDAADDRATMIRILGVASSVGG